MAALMMEKSFDCLDAPLVRVCGEDVPMPYAANLETLALPQVADIVNAAKRYVIKVEEFIMSIQILMPALSPTMTEGNLVAWLKRRR